MGSNLDILVVGGGMYVIGNDDQSYGTIMPSLLEARHNKKVGRIGIVTTNATTAYSAVRRTSELATQMHINGECDFFPEQGRDERAYLDAIEKFKPDAVIVSVPDHLHFNVTSACLEKGLHSLVVKPLTPTIEETQKLITLSKKNNVYGATEFHKRWDRQIRILRDEYQSGKLGIPLYTWTEYSQRKSIPNEIFRSWVEKINILQYLGVHYIDIVRFVTGAIPIRVMATGQKAWLKEQGLDIYDAIQCIVEWQSPERNNFTQTLLVNWIDPNCSTAMSDQNIKFVGTRGRFEGDQKERGVKLIYDDQHLEEPNPDFCHPYRKTDGTLSFEGYGIDSIASFLNDVSDIMGGECTPQNLEGKRPTFSEAIISTAVIDAAHKSLSHNSGWQENEL